MRKIASLLTFLTITVALCNHQSALGLERKEPATSHVLILMRGEGGVAIKRVNLQEGETRKFVADGTSGFLDVIFPLGRGGSRSIVNASDEHTSTVTYKDGQLSVVVRSKNGEEWQRPSRHWQSLQQYNTRLSVIAHDGPKKSFLIRRYEYVSDEPIGPVMDPFAGRIPTQTDDYILYTDTYPVYDGTPRMGHLTFEYDRHLFVKLKQQDGTEREFIIDLGSGETLVAKSFLPEGVVIEPSKMTEYSSLDKRLLDYTSGGATGNVMNVLGHATLADLSPAMSMGEVSVAVIEEMPDIFGRPVAGILGLDLLQQTDSLILDFPSKNQGEKSQGKLVLDPHAIQRQRIIGSFENGFAVPFAMVNSHIMVRGDVNGQSTSFILDTGAPEPFLDEQAVEAAGVQVQPDKHHEIYGLDAGKAQASSATIKTLAFGEHSFSNVDCRVSALRVFAPMRVHDQAVGLLGNSFFAQFSRLEIDFANHLVLFYK